MIVTRDGTVVNAESGDITDVQTLIAQIAQEEGIPPEIALAVAQQESGFDAYAVGDGGHSHGLYQENDQGRGAGRDPDYDVVNQVRRFAAEYRNAAAVNPGADMATLAYLAQRPADREGYINSLNGILGTGGGGSRLAAPMPDAFKPKGPIKAVQIFGNQVQVTYQDDAVTPDLVDLASWEAFTGVRYDPVTGKPATNQTTPSTAITPYQQAQLGQSGSQFAQNLGLNYAQLTEQRRQYDESQGVDKAKFNITQQFNEAVQKWREAVDNRDYDTAQFWARRADEFNTQQVEAANANRDVTRGQTLLGLGSRAETLGRFLYAVQGQQAPQGFDFGTSALPGFGPNSQNPTVPALGASPTAGPIPGLPAQPSPVMNPAAPAVDPRVAATMAAINTPGASLQQYISPLSSGDIATPQASEEQLKQQALLEAAGRKPRGTVNGVSFYEKGGIVSEPVVGQGTWTGLPYMIGEKGPETIVPEGKTLAEVKGKKPKSRKYATGGTIGGSPIQADKSLIGGVWYWAGGPYSGQRVDSTPANAGDLTPYLNNPSLPDPTGRVAPSQPAQMPGANFQNGYWNPNQLPAISQGDLPGFGGTGGMRGGATQPRSVFNPPNLQQYLGGQFLRPGIPNFPQYQQATGGTSLLSNARWLNNATPSELGLYRGFLQDEAGVPPDDALALAGRMAPRSGSLRTPGYSRSY